MKSLLLAILLPVAAQAQTCTPNAVQQAATKTLALQHTLTTATTPVMDTEVPPALRPILHNFKQALIETVETTVRCLNPNPETLQTQLVTLLHANRPENPFEPEKGPPWPTTEIGDYGTDLTITVKPQPTQTNLYSILITYSIECGTDNILLFYRRTPSGYRRELLWQNPDLNSISDAFGDMYLYPVVPSDPSHPYLVAVVHGTPWCTSTISNFRVDLLAPKQAGHPQSQLSSLNQVFRIEDDPRLKLTPDGFDLRATADDLADSTIMRPGIFRYRTNQGRLERVQPIANNARDFVDEWLQIPWSQAANWSAQPPDSLKPAHNRFDFNLHPNDDSYIDSYGPTRACSSSKDVFQIEIDIAHPKNDDTAIYARVRQNPNSFTMLSITPQPDPTCTGPDLMRAAKP
jgi:hypothetical protein